MIETILCIIGRLWGESTGNRRIPLAGVIIWTHETQLVESNRLGRKELTYPA